MVSECGVAFRVVSLCVLLRVTIRLSAPSSVSRSIVSSHQPSCWRLIVHVITTPHEANGNRYSVRHGFRCFVRYFITQSVPVIAICAHKQQCQQAEIITYYCLLLRHLTEGDARTQKLLKCWAATHDDKNLKSFSNCRNMCGLMSVRGCIIYNVYQTSYCKWYVVLWMSLFQTSNKRCYCVSCETWSKCTGSTAVCERPDSCLCTDQDLCEPSQALTCAHMTSLCLCCYPRIWNQATKLKCINHVLMTQHCTLKISCWSGHAYQGNHSASCFLIHACLFCVVSCMTVVQAQLGWMCWLNLQ